MKLTKWLLGVMFVLAASACSDSDESTSTCGDFAVESGEACDDGNTANGDGCNATCDVEPGFNCLTAQISVCSSICGDGMVVGSETCDDGNQTGGDGCSSSCATEEANELSCADGADNDADGQVDCADSDCAASADCTGTSESGACADGVDNDNDGRTDCDDTDCATDAACGGAATETNCGDAVDNDGDGQVDCADSDCADNVACGGLCGNGTVDGTEQCDDGAANSNTTPDACREDCTNPRCGDMVVDASETCDDGPANGSGGACLDDCSTSPTAGCTGTGFVFLNALGTTIDRGVRYEVGLNGTVGDTMMPPAACATTDGYDVRLAYRAPETATYVVEVDGASATLGTTTYLTETCNGGASFGCDSGIGGSVHGRVFFDALQGEDWFIVIDADQADVVGTALVTVRAIDAVLADGATCDPESTTTLCGTGSLCTDGVCAEYAPTIAGLDQSCDVDGVDPVCAPRLECSGETSTCVPVLGAACRSAFDISTLGVGDVTTGGLDVSMPTGDVLGDGALSCGTDSARAFGTWTAPSDGVLLVDAANTGGGPVAIAIRATCGESESELACADANLGGASTELRVTAGTSYTLIAQGTGMVDLRLELVPFVELGGVCDRDLATDRCVPPLVCGPLDTCMEPIAASCGDPIDAVENGAGASLYDSRGLLVAFDNREGVNETATGCGTGGNESVIVIREIGNANVTLNLQVVGGNAFYEVRTNCGAPSSALLCDQTTAGSGRLEFTSRAGEDFFVIVEGADVSVSGSLSVRAERLVGAGESCADATCIEPLVCNASDRCVGEDLPPGSVCGPSLGTCSTGVECIAGICVRVDAVCDPAEPTSCSGDSVCVNFFDLIYCSARVTEEGGACDDVLVSCAPGLTCTIGAGDTFGLCSPSEGGVGDPCADDSGCGEALVCLKETSASTGVCSATVADFGGGCNNTTVRCPENGVCMGFSEDGVGECNSARGPGQPCFFGEGDEQCSAFLVCADTEFGAVCALPTERTPGGENCFENPACEDGFLCWPLSASFEPSPSSVCEPALFEGQACTANSSEGVCFPPLSCVAGTCQAP